MDRTALQTRAWLAAASVALAVLVIGSLGLVLHGRTRGMATGVVPQPLPPPANVPPADFALRYEFREGSLPPPAHYEYSIRIGPGGRGTFSRHSDRSRRLPRSMAP